jgi:hypothetical protein
MKRMKGNGGNPLNQLHPLTALGGNYVNPQEIPKDIQSGRFGGYDLAVVLGKEIVFIF